MTPEQIASLPVQVLFVFAVITLFKALMDSHKAHLADLKQVYGKNTSDLNNRVMMIEDRLGIKPPLGDDAVIPGAKLN